VKTNLDFTEARDSEWQWHQLGRMQICTSLQTDNHASTPPLSFLQAGCPRWRPTNSVDALKAESFLPFRRAKLRQLLFAVVVDGLNNFQVGMPSDWPTEGSPVDGSSYRVCGTQQNMAVAVGLVVTVECPPSDQQFRYIIVQSLDTEAEKLCLAEVGVFEAGRHGRLHIVANGVS